MTPPRVRLLNFVIRHTAKRRLAACRTPLELRAVFDSSLTLVPPGARHAPDEIGGVPGEWTRAARGGGAAGTLVYLHGGGYVAMSAKTHRSITAGFALRGFRVFAPNYRLAPEHTFPAALDDATAAWRALRAQVEGPMFLAGDSAGGGLALALMLNLRDLGAPGPTAACLFSPWTDLVGTGASIAANRNRDPLLTMDGIEDLVAVYAGGVDPRTPLISPLFGDFAGLAPMIVFVGDTELLLDDSRQLADRAARAGVPVDLRVYPDMPHVWPTMNVFLREGRRALDEAAAFLKGAEGEAAG